MSDAWARLCESVGETPETVFAGYKLVTRQPDPPAYLRPPNRKRWRGLIRAALGPKYRTGWQYRIAVAHRLDPSMCRSGNIWNGIADALWNER
jgi:hypothetical protein